MLGMVQAMLPFLGDGMGEPYLGGGAAGGTDSDGDVGDVSGDGAAGVAVAEGGVGDAAGLVSVRVLPVMPCVLMLLVMQWWMVSLGTLALMLRVLQGMLQLKMRVLQVMVLGVGQRMGACRRFWAWALATLGGLVGVGGRLARRSWWCWSPVVSGQLLANPGGGWCR